MFHSSILRNDKKYNYDESWAQKVVNLSTTYSTLEGKFEYS